VLKGSLQDGQVPARYGGEEFAVLLPNSSIEDGMRVAATLRTRVKSLSVEDRRRGGTPVSITISLGVTALRSGDDASRFIARADGALYNSKQNGRDRVSFA
jgi:diguanylate cyclase